jgi:hypothetical protein
VQEREGDAVLEGGAQGGRGLEARGGRRLVRPKEEERGGKRGGKENREKGKENEEKKKENRKKENKGRKNRKGI